MNFKQWKEERRPLLEKLEPGTYTLHTICLSSQLPPPQAHEGVFLLRDVQSGLFPRISLAGKEKENGSNVYDVVL